MNKKVIIAIIAIIVIIIGVVIVAKCLPKQEILPEETEGEVDDSLFTINETEFHFDEDKIFKEVKYTVSGEFKEADMDKYVQYSYYPEGGSNLLFFRIFDYNSKSVEEAAADLGIEEELTLVDGKTDIIEYKLFDRHRDDGTIHFYFINNENHLYVLQFTSKYDIKDFEERVLKSISFVEE